MKILALLLLLLVAACGGDAAAPASELPRWRLEQDLRVGSAFDEEVAFTFISELAVDQDGWIYTVHPSEQMVRVFAPEGALLHTIGRRGAGPGEFGNPALIGLRGDTVWVSDRLHQRISFFTTSGGHVRTATPLPGGSPSSTELPISPIASLPDRAILAETVVPADLVTSGELTFLHLLRLAQTGELQDTLAAVRLTNAVWHIGDPTDPTRGGSFRQQPFPDADRWALAPDGSFILVARQDDSGDRITIRLTWIGPEGDTLRTNATKLVREKLLPAAVDTQIERAARVVRELHSRRGEELPLELARTWARRGLYVPEVRPAADRIMVGRDGTIWLRRPLLEQREREWLVLDPEGEPLATVVTPAGLDVLAADRSHIWGNERDELDVPHLVRYRVLSTQ